MTRAAKSPLLTLAAAAYRPPTLMTECGVSCDGTLMVGDSSVDVQTARNAHVKACGVTWGFQPETFAEFPPDFLIDHPEDLAARVIGRG